MGIFDKAKQAALTATVTKALDYLEKDPGIFLLIKCEGRKR